MKTKNLSRRIAFSVTLLAASTAFAAPAGLEKMFQNIDANNDAIVTVAELAAHYTANIKTRAKAKGWSDEVVAKRLENIAKRVADEVKQMDKDGDGKVSLDEFIAGKSKK